MKPFRVLIKGKPVGNWKANINGKVCDLGEGDSMQAEQAAEKAAAMEAPAGNDGPTIGSILNGAASNASPIADSAPKDSPKAEKQAPGTIRAGGLEELSPALLKKFRETFAAAIADGNYSLDRALIGIFGYIPPNIPEDSKALLKIGWELACQKYFTDGVPPPWIVILFANVQILAKLADGSVKKPETKVEDNDAQPATNTRNPASPANRNESPVG